MKMKVLFGFFMVLTILFTNIGIAHAVDIRENDGIYHVKLKLNRKTAKKLKFISVDDLMTNKEVHERADAVLTINGGFFDPKNKKTVSYVYTDNEISADPLFNENLFRDSLLRKNMDKILNRTEIRQLECFDGYRWEITSHKSPIDFECQLMSSLQAGPLIYPQLQLEEEFFILKDEEGKIIRESASVLHRVPRTILGLEGQKYLHFLIFTDNHPVTLDEAGHYCADLGIDRAMALDGGGSTSLNYLKKINVVSTPEKNQGRALKSFVILKK